jgi:hypothetical protein
MRMLVALLAAAAMVLDVSAPAAAAADAIESDLAIAVQGAEKRISLDQALALLNVPSVSVALIDGGRVAFARAYGKDATPETLYQAASLFEIRRSHRRHASRRTGQAQARCGRERRTHHLARPEQCASRSEATSAPHFRY